MPVSNSPERILNRRRKDHVLLEELNKSACPVAVSGHRNVAEARRGEQPVEVGANVPPRAYLVVYDFDTLVGPGTRRRPTKIVVDPLANGDYPASEPVANVVGTAPWTPHFTNGRAVCHGHRVWVPNRTQLVDYVIHLGRLLNFDEPRPGAGYSGYNGEAIAWWAKELNYQPLDPRLKFPAIDPTSVLKRRRLAPTGQARSGGSRMRGAGTSPTGTGSRLRAAKR
jgi:hypothetical protein